MIILKSTFYPLFLELLKFGIAAGLWVRLSNQPWSSSLLASTAVGVTSMAVYILLTFFVKIRRPLQINVTVTNSVTKDSITHYYAQTEGGEIQRTVEVELNIEKRSSVSSWLSLLLLRKKKVNISFETLPIAQFLLIPEGNKSTILTQSGFLINVTEIVLEFLEEQNACIKRRFQFVINEFRDAEISNDCKIAIKPKYLIGGKKITWMHSLLYDVRLDEHLIRYFNNYIKG